MLNNCLQFGAWDVQYLDNTTKQYIIHHRREIINNRQWGMQQQTVHNKRRHYHVGKEVNAYNTKIYP